MNVTYSLVQFMPFPEREEVVNIGIVAWKDDEFEFKLNLGQSYRFADFFGLNLEKLDNFILSLGSSLVPELDTEKTLFSVIRFSPKRTRRAQPELPLSLIINHLFDKYVRIVVR